MKLKYLIIFLLIIIFVRIFRSNINIYNNLYDNYDSIANYVNNNYKELEKISKKYIAGEKVKYPGVIEYITVCAEYESYCTSTTTTVHFTTSTKGLVPSGTSIGFYYSTNDIPVGYEGGYDNLEKVGKNKWKWNDVGDNHGTTIKIRDNWYYFDASF